MVARGEEQRADVDFGELFAPTAAIYSVRLLAAMACELDLDLRHFDIEQAFVQSDLKKTCPCVCLRVAGGCRRR